MTKLNIKDNLLKAVAEYAEQEKLLGQKETAYREDSDMIRDAEWRKMQSDQQCRWHNIIKLTDELYDFQCNHERVYYSKDHDNFYCENCHAGMGDEYYNANKHKKDKFLQHMRYSNG